MSTLLLVAHIGAAILLIGPATLATSLFPRYATAEGRAVAAVLHRVSRTYGTATLAVPAIGLAMAGQQGILGQRWVVASLVLFAIAFFLLIALVVPRQGRVLAAIEAGGESAAADLAAMRAGAGLFSVAWLAILVLMVAKPV